MQIHRWGDVKRKKSARKCKHYNYHFSIGKGFSRYAICSGCGWRRIATVMSFYIHPKNRKSAL